MTWVVQNISPRVKVYRREKALKTGAVMQIFTWMQFETNINSGAVECI